MDMIPCVYKFKYQDELKSGILPLIFDSFGFNLLFVVFKGKPKAFPTCPLNFVFFAISCGPLYFGFRKMCPVLQKI